MADYEYYLKGYGDNLTVYKDRIVIEHRGVFNFFIHGASGTKTIPMDSIMSVQFKEANSITNGFIQFGVLGGKEATGGVRNAAGDENSVMFLTSSNKYAREIKDYIEDIIFNRNKSTGTVVQQVSSAEELKKFKELLDMGVISQDEFNAKKKQILGL